MLELVGLSKTIASYSHELSGGVKGHESIICGAGACRPEYSVARRNCSGALDPITRTMTSQKEFGALVERLNKTVVSLHYRPARSAILATRIALMDRGAIVLPRRRRISLN